MSAGAEGLRSTFASTAGGVMTEEAGAVTGELEIETSVRDERLVVMVRYAGAEEWYTVSGGPLSLNDCTGPCAGLHERILEHLRTPGEEVNSNEAPTSLQDYDA